MSPLATGCQVGPVPTQGSVPGPLATRSLKAGVWARSLSPPQQLCWSTPHFPAFPAAALIPISSI